jgi:hypothetical protein
MDDGTAVYAKGNRIVSEDTEVAEAGPRNSIPPPAISHKRYLQSLLCVLCSLSGTRTCTRFAPASDSALLAFACECLIQGANGHLHTGTHPL